MKGEIPSKENYHDPWFTNKDDLTVALMLAE